MKKDTTVVRKTGVFSKRAFGIKPGYGKSAPDSGENSYPHKTS